MHKIFALSIFLLLVLNLRSSSLVEAHGRMMKPPNRSSIWRISEFAKKNPPKNYNDNELFCGAAHQTKNPGDECGVCGDALSDTKPRENEVGGTFYAGIITGTYTSGQVIDVEVELTRSHKGFMEWRLCTNSDTESQACFNKYLLQRADGAGVGSKLPVDNNGMYKTKLKLPQGVTCEHCILQWNYRAGNNWGTCNNGTSGLGCGPQETFRGCSDISIT